MTLPGFFSSNTTHRTILDHLAVSLALSLPISIWPNWNRCPEATEIKTGITKFGASFKLKSIFNGKPAFIYLFFWQAFTGKYHFKPKARSLNYKGCRSGYILKNNNSFDKPTWSFKGLCFPGIRQGEECYCFLYPSRMYLITSSSSTHRQFK